MIYVRLSKDKLGRSPGVARQEDLCRKVCEANGYRVVTTMGAKDGSAVHDPRPDFDDMIRRAHAGEWDIIVSYSNDRLSRGYEDTGLLLSPGLPIHTVLGGYSAPTAEGRVHTKLASALAEFETERKRERMRDEYAQRRAAGIPHSGPKLPGLERQTEHAGIIAAGWRRVLDGASLSSIARDWGAAGVRTQGIRDRVPPREPTAWDVKRWLSAQRYAGRLPDGTPGSGPALVGPDLFDAVQRMFTSRTRAPRPGGQMLWALPVVARCGRCGGRLRSSRAGHGKTWHVYRCETGDLVRGGDVPDRFVLRVAAARLEQPDAIRLLLPAVNISVLVTERDALQGRIDALADLILDGTLTADGVRQRSASLRQRVAALDESVREATAQTDSVLLGLPGPDAGQRLTALAPRLLAEVYTLLFEAVILEPPPHRGYRFTDDAPGVTIRWR